MNQTVLILGATGRFGRSAATAFRNAGWTIRGFHRDKDDLLTSATGADVIVMAWNPPYPDWEKAVQPLHAKVIEVAGKTGSTVIVPANVYVFGAETPAPWGPDVPHQASNPLGRVRTRMEDAYRRSGVRTILLRAGDFIDTRASGNWFDQVLTKSLSKGVLTYPGRPDIPHAWAYLPDLCAAAVSLAEKRDTLPRFADIAFAGYTLSGQDMAASLDRVLPQKVRLKQMSWLPLQLARLVWPMARSLLEMRYLWDTPHWLNNEGFNAFLPEFRPTPVDQALANAVGAASSVQSKVNPHQPVAARS